MAAEFPVRAVLDDNGIDMLIAALTKAGKAANMSEKEIKEMNDELRKTGKEGVTSVNNVNKGLNNLVNDGIKKVGAAFLAAFAIDRLVSVGKEIIHITAEFQKFEAVLTNALGSESAAQIGMRMLEKFASVTPFSVQELTASYVKLVNQGFIPTQDEMRKLGDVASSTGKSFDMLTEAIIDAQTGEFERLKEFGIRASKEGDKVTFTFKGVQTQTDFTAQSIRDYVLSLGDAVGVSGSMAAISETLGGGISNMGDAYDHFLEVIGDGNKGPLQNAVRNLTLLLSIATEYLKTDEQIFEDQKIDAQAKAVDNFKALAAAYDDINQASEDYIKLLDFQIQLSLQRSNKMGLDQADERNALEDKIQLLKAEKQAILDLVAAENAKAAKITPTGMNKEDKKAEKKAEEERKKLLAQQLKDQQAQADAVAASIRARIQQEIDAEKNIQQIRIDLKGKTMDHDLAQLDFEFREKLSKLKGSEAQITEQAKLLEEQRNREVIAIREKYRNADEQNLVESQKKTHEAELERLKDQEEQKRQIIQMAFSFVVEAISTVQQIQDERDRNEITALNNKRDYELSLAGDNAKAKDKINKDFDEKERALKTKQVERDKQQALFNIGINTAQGVIAALASVPPNVPLSFFIAAAGLLQAGFVASKTPPKFAHGIFDLQGPGTETSDSITARLSKHETVVPAQGTMNFPELLKHIVENPNTTYADLRNIIDKKIPSRVRGDLWLSKSSKETQLEKKLDEVNRNLIALQNKQEAHINIDENGFRKWTQKGDHWTEYVNKRYSA